MKSMDKYNLTSFRVLYILLLLVRYRTLGLEELNSLLLSHPDIGKTFSSETMSRYIQALRHVGCDIQVVRRDGCSAYTLTRCPFPVQITENQQSLLIRLSGLMSDVLDERIPSQFSQVLQKLTWALRMPVEPLFPALRDDASKPPPAAYSWKDLQRICQEGQRLEINLANTDNLALSRHLLLDPIRVQQSGQQALLIGIQVDTGHTLRLPASRIERIHQLPSKVQVPVQTVTTSFRLYGRLAKTYRLYPGEKILQKTDKSIDVLASTTNPDALILRLMKYGELCEVLTPGRIRSEVLRRIQAHLRQLNGVIHPTESAESSVTV
jgi:predicted DNA-binding transcriptional regulator YafY